MTRIYGILAIATLIFCLLFPPLVTAQGGDWQPIKNICDAYVKEIAEFAVNEYNKIKKKKLAFQNVFQGRMKFIDPLNIHYWLPIAVRDEDLPTLTSNYVTIVWDNVEHSIKELLVFHELHRRQYSLASPTITQSAFPSLIRPLIMAANDSLAQFLSSAVDAAKKAGEIIRKGFYETKHVEYKGQVDLVTETDKACEDLIFNHLKQLYPTHKFIGEETTAANGVTELTDDPTWLVDPVDGTINFVHGFPFVCVSIGLTIGKIPTVGVVYNPIIDELFTGIRGGGAFLNGNPIKVSSQTELVKSLLVTEVGVERDNVTVDATTGTINRLLFEVRSIRMGGSCALALCGIACGRLDLFYMDGYGGPWDVAGGAVIVTEAGGCVYDPSGEELDITSRRVAASNPLLKAAFVDVLRESE
ncbi:hypothetical protein ACFX19_037752 [Malus domestica]